ncbi:Hsp33 family molecular chaperone HslO [Sporosarcina sp. P12(2017)]|uniref:Hsp33 family molecular chaperone HslO n=1 Tax=unclassified Sporosarcina TaxID=2647733 RepID=UPI000C16D320|nr:MULTISPECIES: Hsp33 family molecular chaperone HslO [unclassified Sporosarcina]PIC58037.1 Hsp33 family molecular chaperone HslO [Sporosarcina sp. P10]PIC59428.1 Hsp33 family molecular chaperone HslO [Sporosarcina sp. P12(2017)]
MNDYLVKAVAYQNQVRAYAVNSTTTVAEAQRRHAAWPTAADALGRSMTAGLILGSMLKGEEKISVKINGGGPLGTIIVDSNAKGEVRGYVSNPQADLELNEVGKAVGTNGLLTVSKDVGLMYPFVGQIPLISGEIGEDYTSYLAKSEQTASAVGVGVLVNPDYTVKAAGGFIIQLMPDADEEVIFKIEERMKVIAPLASIIEEGSTPEQILEHVLGSENVTVLESMPVQFQCQCSLDRISNAIISLGREEIQDMIQTDGQAEANCHFCNETYHFNTEQLEALKKVAL